MQLFNRDSSASVLIITERIQNIHPLHIYSHLSRTVVGKGILIVVCLVPSKQIRKYYVDRRQSPCAQHPTLNVMENRFSSLVNRWASWSHSLMSLTSFISVTHCKYTPACFRASLGGFYLNICIYIINVYVYVRIYC